jgi:hypothetical protein
VCAHIPPVNLYAVCRVGCARHFNWWAQPTLQLLDVYLTESFALGGMTPNLQTLNLFFPVFNLEF